MPSTQMCASALCVDGYLCLDEALFTDCAGSRHLSRNEKQLEMAACDSKEIGPQVRTGAWLREGWAIVRGDLRTFAPAALLAGLLAATVILSGPMLVGMLMMVNKRLRGEQIAVDDVFLGFSKFAPALVASLTILGTTLVAQLLLGLTGIGAILMPFMSILIGGITFYTFQIIAATDTDGITAIKQSWAKIKAEVGTYCLANLVFDLVFYAGFLLALVGAMITGPVMIAAMAVAYRDHFEVPGSQQDTGKPEVLFLPVESVADGANTGD